MEKDAIGGKERGTRTIVVPPEEGEQDERGLDEDEGLALELGHGIEHALNERLLHRVVAIVL